MTRAGFAVWTLLVGLMMGMAGTALLYSASYLGAGFSVWMILLAGVAVGSAWYARRPMAARNIWLFVPAVFFAVMVSVRADEWLMTYNVLLTLVLGALALHYMALTDTPFDLTATGQHVGAVTAAGVRSLLELPFTTLFVSRHWFGSRQDDGEGRQRTIAVVRGLVLTLPVLVVFAVLLGSADAVFAGYLPSFEWLARLNSAEIVGRVTFTLFLAWVAVGALTYGVARDWSHAVDKALPDAETLPQATLPDRDSSPKPPKRSLPALFRLSMIEGGMLLGGVNLLFGAFVLVQFVYLFGGRENIGVDGMTFAEYARRGFFELLAVALLTMALILIADHLVVRDGKRENALFRGLALVTVVLVGVLLFSAAHRMALYTDAFGLTRLRLWTSLFMGWLAVLFVVLVAGLYRVRRNVFSFGLVLVAVGFFGTLNVINPDARIAAHNIDRALAGDEELDLCYLTSLSADTVPVIAARYAETEDEQLGTLLAYWEGQQLRYSGNARGEIGSYHMGWARSGRALSGVENTQDASELMSSACYARY